MGLPMVDQRSWVHVLSIISRGCVCEIDIWVLPALMQRLKGWLSSKKESSYKNYAQDSPQTVCWRQADWGHGLLETCPVVWWDQYKLIWFRWFQACVVAWGPGEEYKDKCVLPTVKHGWWECHGLGLQECCRHWGATVHWGNHEC